MGEDKGDGKKSRVEEMGKAKGGFHLVFPEEEEDR